MLWQKRIPLLILGILGLFAPARLLAWGMGHNSQTDQVWRNLPESFRSHFNERQRQDFVRHYSHYTDFFASRNPEPRAEPAAACCAEAVKRLKFNPHKTHIVFPLFVSALREKRYEDALMWAGCISHSIGDMGALNHPDILWFSHVCLGWSGVKGPGGRSIQAIFAPDTVYGKSYFEKKFQSVYDKAMAGYEGHIISEDPQKVLEHIIVRDHLRKVEMNTDSDVYQIFLLMETYNQDKAPETYRKIVESLAAYTAKTNREILDTLITGMAFASMPEPVPFDVKQAAGGASKTLQLARQNAPKAAEMIVFTTTWCEDAPKGAVGVILSDCPSLVYSGGCPFGSKHQWLSSIVLQGLKQQNVPYQCLSYDRATEFNAQQNPVLLVVAPKSSTGIKASFLKSLVDYMQSGGRLVWLGGQVPGKLAEILPAGKIPTPAKDDRFLFPFSVSKTSEQTDTEFVSLPGGTRFRVPNMGLKKISWNTFGECRCLVFDPFEEDLRGRVIMRQQTPISDSIVGVQRACGTGELVYMPWYTICPYMLSEERVMASLVNLGLDSAGTAILLPWLKR